MKKKLNMNIIMKDKEKKKNFIISAIKQAEMEIIVKVVYMDIL